MGGSTQITFNSIAVSIALLLIGGFITFVTTWWWRREANKKEEAATNSSMAQTTRDRITELETQIALVKQSVVPISVAFQAILVKELTHYHTPVMDALMVKLGPPNTLTPDEEIQLIEALKQRTIDMNGRITDSERNAADMLPAVMARAKEEFRTAYTEEQEIQTVSLPLNKEPDKK